MTGPELLFHTSADVALCGPPVLATIDGKTFPQWTRVRIEDGQTLNVGQISKGCRAYLAVHGGFPSIAEWLGSKATSSVAQVGGYQGRSLRAGDLLSIVDPAELPRVAELMVLPTHLRPHYSHRWDVQTMPGPYETGYLSPNDIDILHSHAWEVSHNAGRGGIRLNGPTPKFARADGGDGGSHPSNIIEYGYPIGGLNWTGSQPVIFPVDCPDFGGFLCSSTIVKADWWKMGQMRPGDTVRFHRVDLKTALESRMRNDSFVESVASAVRTGIWDDVIDVNRSLGQQMELTGGNDIIQMLPETALRPQVTYRAGGDSFLLVDYGKGKPDLNHKCHATALKRALENGTGNFGVKHLTPNGSLLSLVSCGNSLMIHFESLVLSRELLVDHLTQMVNQMAGTHQAVISNRRFRLPICFSHQKLEDTMERYMINQRPYATYLPNPFEFVARNNGITTDDLKSLVLELQLIVTGVGFLMALPLCLPMDPRHRLNVPKMDPSRLYTPAGTVSWGGNALAVYADDSPGGYMPIGLTIPGLDMYGYKNGFSPKRPWLFDDLDVITFYEVSIEEYDVHMALFEAGRYEMEYVETAFDLAAYNRFVAESSEEVNRLEGKRRISQQQMAKEEKLLHAKWIKEQSSKESERKITDDLNGDPDLRTVKAPGPASVWKVSVVEGQVVQAHQSLVILEAMKMETNVLVPPELDDYVIERVAICPGQIVEQDQALVFVRSRKVHSETSHETFNLAWELS